MIATLWHVLNVIYHPYMLVSSFGMLGSVDSNTGSPDLGWDTDQFPMDIRNTTMVMKVRDDFFTFVTWLMLVMFHMTLLNLTASFFSVWSFPDHHWTRWSAARRPELWRQGAQRVLRPGGPVHRSHRSHGRLRTRTQECCAHNWGRHSQCYGEGVCVCVCSYLLITVHIFIILICMYTKQDICSDQQERYSSFSHGFGQKVEEGSATLEEMEVKQWDSYLLHHTWAPTALFFLLHLFIYK